MSGHPKRVLNDKGGEASTPQHGAQTLLLHKNIFGGDLLSHTPTGCSTISAKSLNYRVRNETGCTPLAITTEKPSTTTTPPNGAAGKPQTTHPLYRVVIPKPYSERDTPQQVPLHLHSNKKLFV